MDKSDPKKVLVIEDEEKIREILSIYLNKEGYACTVAHNGEEGLRLVCGHPDLVILDLMLPDMDGEDICRRIREDSNVPIIMLTARSGEPDKLKGFSSGADDYVVKPFSPKELMARVKAHLRRAGAPKDFISINGGRLIVHKDNFEVMVDSAPVSLTPTEFKLLKIFIENRRTVLTRNQLLDLVQGYDFEGTDRAVDAHVKNLRQKIEKDTRAPEFIKTIYGVGYRFIGTVDEE